MDALKEVAIKGRTHAEIQLKTLQILKKFKAAYRRRSGTGRGGRANGTGADISIGRYEDLLRICGRELSRDAYPLPPPPPPAPRLSCPMPIPPPIHRQVRPTTILRQLPQERGQREQDLIMERNSLEERRAERLLRERELEERTRLRVLMERQLEFDIRKWEARHE